MANPPAPKSKAAATKATATTARDARAASRSGATLPQTPTSPGDSSATAEPTADKPLQHSPTTKTAAKRFLQGQELIEKSNSPISASTICVLLTHVYERPEITPDTALIIKSIILVLPEAMENAGSCAAGLASLAEKVGILVDRSDPPEDPDCTPETSAKLAELEEKIDQLAESISKSQVSAGAAESAAIETRNTLQSLQQDGWETVPIRSGARQPPPHRHTGSPTDGPQPQPQPTPTTSRANPPTTKRDLATIKRLQSEGCYILVEPNPGPLRSSLDGLNARELVQKADLAWDAAWKALSETTFVKEAGKGDRPRLTFKTAIRLARGGIRYQMDDRTQAAYLSDARVAHAFEKGFGDISCKGQGAPVLLQCAPVTWTPDDPTALRSFERENQLNPGDVISASWVKKVANRSPNQQKAMVRLELRSQELADRLITEGGQLDYAPVLFRKIKQEPTRCLKCQLYGHKAIKCKGLGDICSQCGGAHRSIACDNREKKYCVPCKSDAHCSYERTCPTFRTECERFDQRKPENKSRFFNTTREGETHNPARRPIFHPPSATLAEALPPALTGLPSQPLRAQDLHSYFQRNPRKPWDAPARKPRHVSEPWDNELVITAPLRPVTPPNPTPASLGPPRITPSTGSLWPSPHDIGLAQYTPSRPPMPDTFPLRTVTNAQRSRSSSVSSVDSSTTVQQ